MLDHLFIDLLLILSHSRPPVHLVRPQSAARHRRVQIASERQTIVMSVTNADILLEQAGLVSVMLFPGSDDPDQSHQAAVAIVWRIDLGGMCTAKSERY